MTTLKAQLLPITITPGVQPATDKTALATVHYTMCDKVRFRFGYPQKIGGWYSVPFDYGMTMLGYARSVFSAVLSSAVDTLIGTHLKLYCLTGSALTNVTPLSTATTAAPNSLSTSYAVALAANPFASTSGSSLVTVTDSLAYLLLPGDSVLIAGATAFNGLSSGTLNAAHAVHTVVDATHYTVLMGTAATATGSGGGSSATGTYGILGVTAANTLSAGQRVKITGATAFAGLTSGQINAEFIVRYAGSGAFNVMTAGVATSAVASGGGTGTTFQAEIASGAANESVGAGYGMGLYGVGLYGVAEASSGQQSFPRIWSFDRFGANVVMTPGNQTGVYSWAGSSNVAPALVANAPAAVNYAFVSNDILVTLGAGGVPNQIFASDQGNMTQWTASSSNQVFQYTVSGAAAFVSHVPAAGVNLLFTAYQTYTFSYLGFSAGAANAVWSVKQIEGNVGIIGPMARCSVAGVAYWMGQNNFYMWAAGNVTVIPANSQPQSTLLNYVFKSLNRAQASKCFAWYDEQYDEICFHYPSGASMECNAVARLNRTDLTWAPDTFDRTCAEYPNLSLGYPRLVSSAGVLYAHEQGTDADGAPMPWNLTTNLRSGGSLMQRAMNIAAKENSVVTGFVPDSLQTGDITVTITSKRYPQSPQNTYSESYAVAPDTEFMPTTVGGRFWQYGLAGAELGQEWAAGQWYEYVQGGAPQ